VAETGPPEDDEQLRRKLWLDIARRVVQQGDEEGEQLKTGWEGGAGGCLVLSHICSANPHGATSR
jgi:hypothetical protein